MTKKWTIGYTCFNYVNAQLKVLQKEEQKDQIKQILEKIYINLEMEHLIGRMKKKCESPHHLIQRKLNSKLRRWVPKIMRS